MPRLCFAPAVTTRVQVRVQPLRNWRSHAYDADALDGPRPLPHDQPTRKLRLRRGLRPRVRRAALHLQRARLRASAASRRRSSSASSAGGSSEEELEDLVNLAVNGEIHDPASALGEHVNDCWPELVGPSDRSLVHWLRRLSSAAPGSTSASRRASSTSPSTSDTHTFAYVQPDRDDEPIELAPEPSWGRVAYIAAAAPDATHAEPLGCARGGAGSTSALRAARTGRRLAPRRSRPRRPRRRAARGAACRWRAGRAPGSGRRRPAPRRAR